MSSPVNLADYEEVRTAPAGPQPVNLSDYEEIPATPGERKSGDSGAGVSFGRSALNAITGGFHDEIAGWIDAAIQEHSLRPSADAYRQNRDKYRNAMKQDSEDHGTATTLGTVAGGLAGAFLPGMGAMKGATALGAAGRAAVAGGVAGLGTSDADLTTADPSEFRKAAFDTALGAGTGAVLGGIGHKVFGGAVARSDKRLIQDLGTGAPKPAFDTIADNAPEVVKLARATGLDRVARKPGELLEQATAGKAAAEAEGAAARQEIRAIPDKAQNSIAKLEALHAQLAENPAAASEATRVKSLIDSMKSKWVPPAVEAPPTGQDLLAAVAAKAGPKAKERIAAKSGDVLRVMEDHGLGGQTFLDPIASKAKTTGALETVTNKIRSAGTAIDDVSEGIEVRDLNKALDKVQLKLREDPNKKKQADQVFGLMRDVFDTWGDGKVPYTTAREFLTSVQSEGFSGSYLDPTAAAKLQRKAAGAISEVLDAHLADVAKLKGRDAATKAARAAAKEIHGLNADCNVLIDLDKVATKRAAAAKLLPTPSPSSPVPTGDINAGQLMDMVPGLNGPTGEKAANVLNQHIEELAGGNTTWPSLTAAQGADKRAALLEAIRQSAQENSRKAAVGPTGLRSAVGDNTTAGFVKGAYKHTVGAVTRGADEMIARLVTAARAGKVGAKEIEMAARRGVPMNTIREIVGTFGGQEFADDADEEPTVDKQAIAQRLQQLRGSR